MTPQALVIIGEVAASSLVAPAKLVGRCRSARVVHARIEVAKRLRDRGYSTPRIGQVLKKDHTTIVFYLGLGKKKPTPLQWRKPRIAHLNCYCRLCYFPTPKTIARTKPTANYLVPYAGADMSEYTWKERSTNRGNIRCQTEQQPESSM
jgi:hypothetical protein